MKFPNNKNENWRYVNLRDLKKILNTSQSTNEVRNVLKNQNIESDIIINDEAIHVRKKFQMKYQLMLYHPTK